MELSLLLLLNGNLPKEENDAIETWQRKGTVEGV